MCFLNDPTHSIPQPLTHIQFVFEPLIRSFLVLKLFLQPLVVSFIIFKSFIFRLQLC